MVDPNVRRHLLTLAPYDLHKQLINNYVLTKRGATSLLKRDTSNDKTDFDVIRENHKFLWDETSEPTTWEEQLAKKYYDKLFKEYCICDLSMYKLNQVAMRWQTESEMCKGKGQFICGDKKCSVDKNLRTWEVNFAYIEHGEKKNVLVKLRLCSEHSEKLNHKTKRKEIKRQHKKKKKYSKKLIDTTKKEEVDKSETEAGDEIKEVDGIERDDVLEMGEDNVWSNMPDVEEDRSRDKDFENYLDQLFM